MNRRVLGPLVVAVVAVVAAVLVLWWTFTGDDGEDSGTTRADASSSSAGLPTSRLVSRAGGFSLGVPKGLRGREERGTAYLASTDRTLVILVARSEPGDLASVNRRLVQQMRSNYRTLKVQGSRPEQVDGRKGLSTYGSAVTRKGVRFRFVQTTVAARPRNLTVATFAEQSTDPDWVLPRVNAVLSSLKVRGSR